MASIKGIKIEIDGDTSLLTKALKDVNNTIYSTNAQLKEMQKTANFSSGFNGIKNWNQQQDALKTNISATKERLDKLKQAQSQMGSYSKLTEEQKIQYRNLSIEIAKAESALKSMKKEAQILPGINLDSFKEGLKGVGNIALSASKEVLKLSAAAGTALAGLVAAGVKSYSEFEQVNEGAKLLFGDGYDYIAEKSTQAANKMGMSANDYLQQVNGLAVGLKTALGGNEQAAAELADKVLTAEADIVAATGNTQENVQNAFNGIMKGNFTMLDNLQLGIKPTKEGMQEVIDKVNEWNTAQGKATDYQMGNYADMQAALVDYVEMQGLAGYAAGEASETITGSVNAMKASFENFLTGNGSPDELATSITNVLKNISKAIKDIAPGILNGIVTVIGEVIPQIVPMLTELIPQLLDSLTDMIDSILEMITQNTDSLSETIGELVTKIVLFITDNLPKILEIAVQIVIALAEGIADNLDIIIPAIVQCIITIVGALIEHIPDIIAAAGRLIWGLIQGIGNCLGDVGNAIDGVNTAISDKISELIDSALDWGKDMIKGFIKGIKGMIGKVGDAVKGIADKIKNFLHFSRPDMGPLRDYETWMPDMIKGMVKGIDKSSYLLENATDNLAQNMANRLSFGDIAKNTTTALKKLNYGINNSLNPMINPNANSLMLENQNSGTNGSNSNEDNFGFVANINNYSKYTSPSDNVRLLRQQYELYRLKYGGNK